MNTFILETAVDFSTGVARIGKAHIVEKREEIVGTSYVKRITEMREKNRISEVTKEKVQAMKNSGMSIDDIAYELNCSRTTVYSRLRERANMERNLLAQVEAYNTFVADVIQEAVEEEEKILFRKKVADGTLVIFRGLESVRNISEEVLFCNVETRAKLLEQFGYREANFIVSKCVPDRDVYLLTDEEIKKSILKEKQPPSSSC